MELPLSISEFIDGVKDHLERGFPQNYCEGEISNLSKAISGHYYFTLSDKNASLSCALFKMDAYKNPFVSKVKNGDLVQVRGPLSLYAKRGSFQLIVKQIRPAGQGNLQEKFEQLKLKLAAKGFFDIQRKKTIPKMAKKIALITGYKSAAMADFINVMQRRSFEFDLTIIPALVQGSSSAQSLIKALDLAQSSSFDVIVLSRGGGSMEDLWSFNDERLAQKIFECETPIISAVGHQVDFTICDFVSDLRVETPTAAAQVLSETQSHVQEKLSYLGHALEQKMSYSLQRKRNELEKLSPQSLVSRMFLSLEIKKNRLKRLDPSHLSIVDLPRNIQSNLDHLIKKINEKLTFKLQNLSHKLSVKEASLMALNPSKVLGRGYSMLESSDGKIITDVKSYDNMSKGTFSIVFKDGKRKATKE